MKAILNQAAGKEISDFEKAFEQIEIRSSFRAVSVTHKLMAAK